VSDVRVVFSNNYPMDVARRLCAERRYPRQHLYGTHVLEESGIPVDFAPFSYASLGYRASARLGWRLGDLHQEAYAMRRGSVVYAGEPHHVAGLSRLRRLGLWRHPLVAVVHQDSSARGLLGGVDVAVCLSKRVRDSLRHAGHPDAVWAPWGPDLDLPAYTPTGATHVVSTGKSGRDLPTLLAALDGLDVPAKVYALPPLPAGVPTGVELVTTDRHEDHGGGDAPQFAFERVIEDVRSASVVAIPLLRTDRLTGLTELCDALALGKPVVMTRTPYIDVDLAAIGCGVWVEPGDVTGWRDALRDLARDTAAAAQMGANGRAYAEREWNADAFGRVVTDVVRRVARGATGGVSSSR
jgi:glycosyltransferase involved in cell wall biosynthesis